MANRISVQVKRIDHSLPLPVYAYEGDAGLDLLSSKDVTINPLQRVLIPTGLAVAIPQGYAGFVQPRSGLSYRVGLSMANTPGLVDSNYRGELKVVAINLDAHAPIEIHKGERIAQLVIQEVPIVELVEVDELNETLRGERGFGSSSV